MKIITLYLMRHGEAEPAHEIADAERGLTGAGRRHVRQTASIVADATEGIDVIFTSPLVRAVQTAEIMAAGLGLDEPIGAREAIAYPSSVESWIRLVDSVAPSTRGVLLVGHEPTMGAMTGHLIDHPGPSFRTGTIVALRHSRGQPTAELLWTVTGRPPVLDRVST